MPEDTDHLNEVRQQQSDAAEFIVAAGQYLGEGYQNYLESLDNMTPDEMIQSTIDLAAKIGFVVTVFEYGDGTRRIDINRAQ
jgi:hypothetical protein